MLALLSSFFFASSCGLLYAATTEAIISTLDATRYKVLDEIR